MSTFCRVFGNPCLFVMVCENDMQFFSVYADHGYVFEYSYDKGTYWSSRDHLAATGLVFG